MVGSEKDEKRKFPRVGFAAISVIVVDADGKTVNLQADSRDLSLKGIFIATKKKFACGIKCAVKVYLTGTMETIELLMEGTIVRVADNGVGIRFESMDVDTYSHLKNIVQYNSLDKSI